MSNLTISLIITVVGMGLVFIAILLLWALMEIIVKITAKESKNEEPDSAPGGAPGDAGASPAPTGFKQRVAAAAVGVALALRRGRGLASSPVTGGEGTNPSVWLAAGRLAALDKPAAVKRKQA